MKRFLESTRHAKNGFMYALLRERNFQIEIGITFLVLLLALIFRLSIFEQIFVIGACVFVLCLELANSAFEKLIDIVKPRFHGQVKIAKDMMAAMVFLGSLFALFIGIYIFLPYIFEYF